MTHPLPTSHSLTRPVRPLPLALAHAYMRTALADDLRQALLAALYKRLTPAEKMVCRAELARCRAAKRGESAESILPQIGS